MILLKATLAALGLLLIAIAASADDALVHDVAEFNIAVKNAQPGDRIALADGEWRDADLLFDAEGMENDDRLWRNITLAAETPGRVVLTGNSRLRIAGRHLLVENLLWRDSTADDAVVSFRAHAGRHAENCRLYSCAVMGDAPDHERKWVSLYGKQNVIDHCRFDGKRSSGATVVVWLDKGAGEHAIAGTFFGPRPRLGKNGGETIRVGDSKTSQLSAGIRVVQNYFYRCDGEAEIISNKSCDNEYADNVFVGCGGALTLRHGARCTVRKNRFFGDGRPGTGGVRVIGEDHLVEYNEFRDLEGTGGRAALSLMNGVLDSPLNGYFQVLRAQVRYNDFMNCRETVLLGSRDKDVKVQTLPPCDCLFERNFLVVDQDPAFHVMTAPVDMKFVDNYIDGKLGLAKRDGWSDFDAQLPRGRTSRIDPRRTDYGPDWLRPGDEFLPEVLKQTR